MSVRITLHASKRFNERVKPALTRLQAERELRLLLERAVELPGPPLWHNRDEADGRFVELSDGICAVLDGDSVVTILCRAEHSAEVRAARNRRRARKRRARHTRNASQGHHNRSGAHGARPRIEEEAWPA